MSLYLTSDLHFGHQSLATRRGFDSVEAHDVAIMEVLYESLDAADSLWILGDLSASARGELKALEYMTELRDNLGVRLHLIEGNHDRVSSIHRDGWKHQPRFLQVFDSVRAFARRRGPERTPVLLSHYPYLRHADGPGRGEARFAQYRLPDLGEWLVHGHTHEPNRLSAERQIHVGWDAWRRPVGWNEIEQIIRDNQEEE